jgi:hypothetical protein
MLWMNTIFGLILLWTIATWVKSKNWMKEHWLLQLLLFCKSMTLNKLIQPWATPN